MSGGGDDETLLIARYIQVKVLLVGGSQEVGPQEQGFEKPLI